MFFILYFTVNQSNDLLLVCFICFQAFNKCKREGFRLQTVDKAPLAKRRKMKKTSTSTETRSSSSESTHSSSSSSQSQEKTFPEGEANPQPSSSTPDSTPVALETDSRQQSRPPAFHFSEGQWGGKKGKSDPAPTVETDSSSSVPGSFLPLAQLHGRLHVSKNQACSRSSNCHLSINQLIITSNSLSSSFSLTFTHCVNQGLDQKEVGVVVSEKGCSTDNGEASTASSWSPCPLHVPVFVYVCEGFKGKGSAFTPRRLCIFHQRKSRNATKWNLGPFLFPEKKVGEGYLYMNFKDWN